MPEAIDILMISPGTTAGWREADRELAGALRDLGRSVAVESCKFRIARHLRRGVLATDLAEATALRHATTRALKRLTPRAIIFSSSQAAIFQPRRRLRNSAVRFDAPAALNRPGRATAIVRTAERRSLSAAKLLLPYGLEPSPSVRNALPPGLPMIALPVPISGVSPAAEREPIALAYAGNPEKKGLDRIVAAWATTPHERRRLVVAGIDADRGRRFLDERNLPEPSDIEWVGLVAAQQFRHLLSGAELLIAASRFEDYGQTQLEALAAGALLVTTPSAGPYEALGVARKLDPRLVDDDLGAALSVALTLPEAERDAYRAGARELTRDYSRERLRELLREQVLPALGL